MAFFATSNKKIYLPKLVSIIWQLLRRNSREKLILPILLKIFKVRIITNSEFRNDCNNYRTIHYGENEYIQSGGSYIIGNTPVGILDRMQQKFTILNPWVSEINNAQLIGSQAVGFNENGNIISPSTLPPKENLNHRFEGGLPLNTIFIKKTPNLSTFEFDTACSLINYWSKNYYHWVIDCLTRIEGVEYYKKQTGCQPVLIINSNPTSWQIESLKLLGYNSDDYLEWNISKAKVKKLIVPSFRRQGEWVAPSALHWLRERILGQLNLIKDNQPDYSQNIYVSRAKASGRRVINEDEVIDFLKPLGFVSYSLEEMSFSQQVRLFSSAKRIIAPHGAGLTNIIFSPHNTSVIEFVTPWVSSGYFVPSTILGFKHGCIECYQPSSQKLRQTRGDIIVDIASLRKLIKQMG